MKRVVAWRMARYGTSFLSVPEGSRIVGAAPAGYGDVIAYIEQPHEPTGQSVTMTLQMFSVHQTIPGGWEFVAVVPDADAGDPLMLYQERRT